jgi:hypothetical protein
VSASFGGDVWNSAVYGIHEATDDVMTGLRAECEVEQGVCGWIVLLDDPSVSHCGTLVGDAQQIQVATDSCVASSPRSVEHDSMAFVAIGDRRGDIHDLFAIHSALSG